MFGLFSRRILYSFSIGRSKVLVDSITYLQFLQYFGSRSSLVVKLDSQITKFTVSYLMESCGLSPEIATSVGKKLVLKTSEKPDAVLSFLREHGFTKTHIAKLIRLQPRLLLVDIEKILLPKLQFFMSLGVSKRELANLVSSHPALLTWSLNNTIIPCYNLLKNVVCLDDSKIVSSMKRKFWFPNQDMKEHLVRNISILRGLAVPQSSISVLITSNPSVVVQNTEKFDECVHRAIKMGFNPLKLHFVKAMVVLCSLRSSTWEKKVETYRGWGWSEDEILSAFKKQPICMTFSEEKITGAMDFLLNEMGMNSSSIAECPFLLFFSLKKRIIPRGSVFKVLQLQGLIKKDICFSYVLGLSEKYFVDKFVNKYLDDVPQLLKIFGGEMGLDELGFRNEQLSR